MQLVVCARVVRVTEQMGGRWSRGGGTVGGMHICNVGDRRHGQTLSRGRGGRWQAMQATADVGGLETGASGKSPPYIML